VAVAIGDAFRERLVLEAVGLAAESDAALRVVRRCLDAGDLLTMMRDDEADVLIVSADLHGLGPDAVRALSEARQPVLLVAATADRSDQFEALRGAPVTVLPHNIDSAGLRLALETAVRTGGRLRRPAALLAAAQRAQPEADVLPPAGALGPPAPLAHVAGTILAVVGPSGGHGVTTVAIGLAAGLSRAASVALIDLNLVVPTLALALDLNPARNLYMVLHEAGPRRDPTLWSSLLEAELQSLDRATPRGVVLAGVPGSSLAADVGPDGVRHLLRELARHERFVVADVGTNLDASTSVGAAHRAALEAADRVLVVARADVIGLRRASALLGRLRGIFGGSPDRLCLVLNRHQPRHHHDAIEVARALHTTVAAVIPDDPAGVQATIAAQRALVAFGGTRRGSAARAIVELAAAIEAASSVRALSGQARGRQAQRQSPPRSERFSLPWRSR